MIESSFLNPSSVVRAAQVHEGARVADFGAGSGFFTRAAARAVGASGEVWAVDVHQDLLPRIKNLALAEGLQNIEVVRGDVEKPGGSHLPEHSFDFVLIANLLFASHRKQGIATEAARVLRRGGRAVVVDWKDSFGGLGPAPEMIVSKEAVSSLFGEAGFRDARDIQAGAYHFGCILTKTAS